MSSIRTTNALLAIIGACLLAIVAKDFIPAVLPAAVAQQTPGTSSAKQVEVRLYACHYVQGGTGDGCAWKAVSLTQSGAVITALTGK